MKISNIIFGSSYDDTLEGKIRVSIYRKNVTRYNFREQGDNMYPLYYVYGQVISKDNKTYIKANSVFKKSEIYTEIFWSVLAILFFPLYSNSTRKSV